MISDLKIKIKYLLESCSLGDLGLMTGTSGLKISQFLKMNIPLSENPIKKIEKQFAKAVVEEKLEILRVRASLPESVKNYDDEELSCVKFGTNRSGVNRQTSSFATSNNGISYDG